MIELAILNSFVNVRSWLETEKINDLLAVALGTSTRCAISRQDSLFQVNGRFADDVITSDEVIIHDGDFEIFYNGNGGIHLK